MSTEKSEWYILHVHDGRENKVVEILQKKLPSQLYRPFVPCKEIFFRRAGITKIENKICFFGYVFIESKTTAEIFKKNTEFIIRNVKEIYSVLNYDGKDDYALNPNEMMIFSKLFGNEGCLKVSYGNSVNGKIQVTSGSLVGLENMIKKIDRHKRYAELEIMIFGKPLRINAALEVGSKI